MKHLILASALMFVAFSAVALNPMPSPSPTPMEKEVQIGINDAYIPRGFDSNADIFVVTNGIFPNSCYHWKRAEVNNVDNFNHEVKSIASVSQGMCLMVMIPFTKEVHMGKFVPGKHTIRFLNGDGTYLEKDLSIEQ